MEAETEADVGGLKAEAEAEVRGQGLEVAEVGHGGGGGGWGSVGKKGLGEMAFNAGGGAWTFRFFFPFIFGVETVLKNCELFD